MVVTMDLKAVADTVMDTAMAIVVDTVGAMDMLHHILHRMAMGTLIRHLRIPEVGVGCAVSTVSAILNRRKQ